jgi:hypothetical protein
LPQIQRALSEAVLALGGPTVVVLINGGAVVCAQEVRGASTAVVEVLLPGFYGATVIANGLFGKHTFGGRLPRLSPFTRRHG